MIISEPKPFAEIEDSLKNISRVFLVGCGDCATVCRTGGEPQVAEMKARLEAAGKTVTGSCVPGATCVAAKLKAALAASMARLRESEAVLVLACGSGVQAVQENDRFGLVVLPACETLGAAVLDGKGNLYERCSMCGECVLALTGGICPSARCPKGILNGPCGGMDKGKCELDKERDCAWVLVYKRLEERKKLDEFRRARAPKDHRKSRRPRSLRIT